MNDLRSREEDRPYRPSAATSTSRSMDTMDTSEYYRERLFALRQSRWFPLASVLLAVLVFSGIVTYAYKQGSQTSVNATTPVIQASNTDYKSRPADPGGMDVPFQDAVVFDQISKEAQPETIENLLASPEQPVAATVTTAKEKPAPKQIEEKTAANSMAAVETDTTAGHESYETVEKDNAVEPDPVKVETVAVKEETAPAPASTTQAKVSGTSTTTTTTTTETTASKTPDDTQELAAVKPAAAPPAATTTPATATQPGSYRIQLGAFRDESAARAAWNGFKAQFPSDLGSITPDFARADLGDKGVFYRVQGTNLSKTSAEQLCQRINAQRSGSCLVTQ